MIKLGTISINYTFLEKLIMKEDIKQVNDIAKRYNMTKEQRRAFGKFLENQKEKGLTGTKNERGDYTYEELAQKACEFLDNGNN